MNHMVFIVSLYLLAIFARLRATVLGAASLPTPPFSALSNASLTSSSDSLLMSVDGSWSLKYWCDKGSGSGHSCVSDVCGGRAEDEGKSSAWVDGYVSRVNDARCAPVYSERAPVAQAIHGKFFDAHCIYREQRIWFIMLQSSLVGLMQCGKIMSRECCVDT